MFEVKRSEVDELMYDVTTRNVAARDHIETLRKDFRAPSRSARVAVGRRLVRLGLRLAGDEIRLVQAGARRPSEAYP